MKSIAHAHGSPRPDPPLPLPQPARDREHQRDREVGGRVRQHAGRVRDPHAVLARRVDVDVVVADGHVRDDPQLLAGRVEQRVRRRGRGASPRPRPRRRTAACSSSRSSARSCGETHTSAPVVAQRGERRLRQAAGDDDAGHARQITRRSRSGTGRRFIECRVTPASRQ